MGQIKRMSVEIDIDLDDFDDDELKEELEARGFAVFDEENSNELDKFTFDRSDIEDIAYLIASGNSDHALRRIGDATNDHQIEPHARHMAKVRGK